MADHAALRESFLQASAQTMSPEALPVFAQRFSAHIRKEERHLFERVQQLMTPVELSNLGLSLADALKDAALLCAVPNEATKLKPKK